MLYCVFVNVLIKPNVYFIDIFVSNGDCHCIIKLLHGFELHVNPKLREVHGSETKFTPSDPVCVHFVMLDQFVKEQAHLTHKFMCGYVVLMISVYGINVSQNNPPSCLLCISPVLCSGFLHPRSTCVGN